ncbi:6-phosphogluconolactonase [Gracilibacillus orientalis]|uniref:6-phosphogluconolactonase n=1 Tax=Gracilibacillus orientalis TaxID=334253 RepID=A0A1I4HJT3_9BACI|nr:lactonase family protein [Gracilibacillus orientalis]SFL42384.1 6-phosphogluconolactonase [Gracilibacillus orientalis]
MSSYKMFVGGYGQEEDEAIQVITYDFKKQSFKKLLAVKGIQSPSFLAIHPYLDTIYAVSEVDNGEVAGFQLDSQFIEVGRQSTKGSGPCYVHADEEGEFLLIANYGEGNISLHPLQEDGSVETCSDVVTLPIVHQEKNSHPHTCYPLGDQDTFLVTDLGQDSLSLFRLDRNQQRLIHVHSFELGMDKGARHIVVYQNRKFIYIANEFSSTVSVYRFNQEKLEIELIQEISTIPQDVVIDNYCADIHFSPDEHFLYVSNRGRDSITVFQVFTDGMLTFHDEVSTLGRWPRNFAVTPDGAFILVANEHSDMITVLKITSDGTLQQLPDKYEMIKPTCLKFLGGK